MSPCFSYDVLLYLEILVDEVGSIGVVGQNASYVGGGEDYCFGLLGIEEFFYGSGIKKVELCVGAPHEVGVAARDEIAPDCRTD